MHQSTTLFTPHNVTLADYQSTMTKGLTLANSEAENNVTTTTAISTPVELTHLFMNKDGTLDSSKLFNSVHQFFPKKEKAKESQVFKTENNTSMKAHSGSTVVLPCLVEKEGQFEMVRVFERIFLQALSHKANFHIFTWILNTGFFQRKSFLVVLELLISDQMRMFWR